MNQIVTVIGLGYVGAPLALALAESKRFTVYGYDISEPALSKLKSVLTAKNKKLLQLTSDPQKSLSLSDIIVICVPTPITAKKRPDFSALKASVKTVSKFLKPGQLVIIESTIYPGICEEMILPLLEKSGLKGGRDFELSHCPERINPGDKVWTLKNIPRNVGSLTAKGLKRTVDFYHSFITAPITELNSLREVECTKMVENVFRDVNIAFVNELAMSLDQLGLDAVKIIEAAATKPFSFLAHYPGVGVGGDCIATDPYYYIEMLRQYPIQPRLVKLARSINSDMPNYVVSKFQQLLKQQHLALRKTKVAVLGLSYKPMISDTRNSPALEVVKKLKELNIKFEAFDPYVPSLSTAETMDQAITGAQAVILCTAHPEFVSKLIPAYLTKQNIAIVIDGRNSLNKPAIQKAGIIYVGVGR